LKTVARSWLVVVAAGVWALVPSLASAEDSSGPTATSGSSPWQALSRRADARGIEPSVVYDGEALVNARGGIRRGATYLGVFRAQLLLDAERGLGWQGTSFFGSVLQTHGGNPSDLVGDAQGTSNLAAPPGAQLYEAWLQQNLAANRLSVLAGRYDLGSEFYRLQSAGLFVNSSFGIGPEFGQSGQRGPSIFPDTSLGARLSFKPARGVVLRVALLDGVPVSRSRGAPGPFASSDGLLLVAEQAFLSRSAGVERGVSPRLRIGRNSGLRPYRHKLAFGGWCYTARFDDLSQRLPDGREARHIGSSGVYLIADALLRGGAAQSGQVNAFAQVGLGDPRVNRFGFYTGAGVVVSGLSPALANDELGLAVAVARSGSHYLDLQRQDAVPVSDGEASIELTYLFQLGQHLAIQPDLQYVLRPGSDPTLGNALVTALRFELHS
jgi:porin